MAFSLVFPNSSRHQVTDVFNPNGDGNCGFRCIAKALYDDQENFGLAKSTMLETLVEGERF
jgi:hypothetical protein